MSAETDKRAAPDDVAPASLTLDEQRRLDEQERWSDSTIDNTPVLGPRGMRRLRWLGAALVVLILLVTLPPLVNVNRFQRRVSSAIAESIGRPVRFDSIELRLLPLPGFTIHNFVVLETSAFGAEPAMRANVVEARIRVGSLWRRRVEISNIHLQAPNVNLVRNAAGAWNLQGVVSQAARVQSAPTAQARASSAPRFPYISATDARINVKLGDTKQPFALTDATFALWLPNEQQWHLRLAGRPLRTDTDVSDVGELRVDATLGRGADNVSQQPLSLSAHWKPTPMGEAAKLAFGHDTGWRGSISGEAQLEGTPASLRVTSDVHVRDLRRAEFVPAETVQLDVHCQAAATGDGHALHAVRCALPTATHASLLEALPLFKAESAPVTPDVLTLVADVPDTANPQAASVHLTLAQASVDWVLRWMRLFSTRMTDAHPVGGTFSLQMNRQPGTSSSAWTWSAECACMLPARIGTPDAGQPAPWTIHVTSGTDPDRLTVLAQPAPVTKPLDVRPPAKGIDGVSAMIDRREMTVRYPTAAAVRRFALIVPALGDNLPLLSPAFVGALTSTRTWGQPQLWSGTATPTATTHRRSPRRHR